MNQTRQSLVAAGILALILAVIGIFIVPAHSVSIWMDREFTDWVSPIANRLSAHSRLYEDGLHSPMPPLPFILVHLVWPHGARWIDASGLYFLFQAGLILLLFLAFSRQLGPTTAFICALIVLPVYFSFPKTILYDSMAQLFVAACGITTAVLVRPRRTESEYPPKWPRILMPFLGLQLALLLLTKQNTFAGTALGISVVMVFLPRAEAFRLRIARLLAVLVSAGIFFCLFVLALNRWVSFSGLIADVFLNGSEPKGGATVLLGHLLYFGARVGGITAGWGFCLVLLYWLSRRVWRALDYREVLDGCISPPQPQKAAPRFFSIILCTLLLSVVAFLAVCLFARTEVESTTFIWLKHCRRLVLNLGLALACFFAGCVMFRKFSPKGRDWGSRPLAVYAVVFLLSAVFHSLSVRDFRWSYDNNPLIFSALTFVICGSISAGGNPALSTLFRFAWVRFGGLGVYLLFFWSGADMRISVISECTESWPEIKHLSHARLRPPAAGMRSLVETVRAQADPAWQETVLLLPNDPNIEAWFERKRPRLSSAIIFQDQYWDRYVEEDLARLKRQPPKVIIIGPRNYWLNFSQDWKRNLGATRFINLVKEEILPKNYELFSEQPITFRGGGDFMDVYVLRVNAANPAPAAPLKK